MRSRISSLTTGESMGSNWFRQSSRRRRDSNSRVDSIDSHSSTCLPQRSKIFQRPTRIRHYPPCSLCLVCLTRFWTRAAKKESASPTSMAVFISGGRVCLSVFRQFRIAIFDSGKNPGMSSSAKAFALSAHCCPSKNASGVKPSLFSAPASHPAWFPVS